MRGPSDGWGRVHRDFPVTPVLFHGISFPLHAGASRPEIILLLRTLLGRCLMLCLGLLLLRLLSALAPAGHG